MKKTGLLPQGAFLEGGILGVFSPFRSNLTCLDSPRNQLQVEVRTCIEIRVVKQSRAEVCQEYNHVRVCIV